MFLDFFQKLRNNNIQVSLKEYFCFLSALNLDFIKFDLDRFYFLARSSLIKDEKNRI